MKHCIQSAEPTCLSEFRSKYPDATWDYFKNEGRKCFNEIRKTMLADQSGLCAYCEILLKEDNRQVAHFHPKSDRTTPHNWDLDWNNLWLACLGGTNIHDDNKENYLPPLSDNISCDQKKGSKILDDLVLSPHEIPAFPLIFKFMWGEKSMDVVPDEAGCSKAGIPVDKVQRTIDEFNLNCRRLSEARWGRYRGIVREVKRIRESPGENPEEKRHELAKQMLSKDKNECWSSFFTLTRWSLKDAAEEYLMSTDYKG